MRQSRQRKHCASLVESQSLTLGFTVSDITSVPTAKADDNYVCDFRQCAVITGAFFLNSPMSGAAGKDGKIDRN